MCEPGAQADPRSAVRFPGPLASLHKGYRGGQEISGVRKQYV